MQNAECMVSVQSVLQQSDIDPLDAELLLAFAMGCDRSHLITHADSVLTKEQEQRWFEYCVRRKKNEPLAYIIGEKEFYGRRFFVDERVLIPRCATEGIIDTVSDLIRHKMQGVRHKTIGMKEVDTDIVIFSDVWSSLDSVETMVDVGTGSGCIAVTLALEHPGCSVIATDVSTDALQVAQLNVDRYKVDSRVALAEGSLLYPVQDVSVPFLLVSNPPYIPVAEELMPDVEHFEPHQALFGGIDGADLVLELYNQAKDHPSCYGIIMECRSDHVHKLQS